MLLESSMPIWGMSSAVSLDAMAVRVARGSLARVPKERICHVGVVGPNMETFPVSPGRGQTLLSPLSFLPCPRMDTNRWEQNIILSSPSYGKSTVIIHPNRPQQYFDSVKDILSHKYLGGESFCSVKAILGTRV